MNSYGYMLRKSRHLFVDRLEWIILSDAQVRHSIEGIGRSDARQ
jgi:hypothetical protein